MKRFLLLISVFGGFSVPLIKAQQDPQYTHFTYNRLMYNPAYAGASDQFCINGNVRQQWLGYTDKSPEIKTQMPGSNVSNDVSNVGPLTMGGGFSAPIAIKKNGNRLNIGGAFVNFIKDKIAYENNTYLQVGAAGAYTTADNVTYRVGLQISSITKALDAGKLRYHDPLDPNIPTGNPSDTKTEYALGFYYQNPNIFNGLYGGLSVTHLIPQLYNYGSSSTIQTSSVRHIYMVGGFKMDQFMANPLLTLEPAVMIKMAQGANGGIIKPEVDLQGMVTYNDQFAGGLNLRSYGVGIDALSFMFGYYPPLLAGNGANAQSRLRVGYAYDLTLSNIRGYAYGTNELQVNYCFTFELPPRPPKIYRHPRYMNRLPNQD